MPTPTAEHLIAEIRSLLSKHGSPWLAEGPRDKHFAVWIVALILDEAAKLGPAVIVPLIGSPPIARFREKPGSLDDPPAYTRGFIHGPLEDWQVHVDIRLLGASGALHGVDVALVPATALRRRGHLRLPRRGLGIEVKCFATRLTPNEGRVTLGFYTELRSHFWLATNGNNEAVRKMLRMPGRRTNFFPDLEPHAASEQAFRAAIRSHLERP